MSETKKPISAIAKVLEYIGRGVGGQAMDDLLYDTAYEMYDEDHLTEKEKDEVVYLALEVTFLGRPSPEDSKQYPLKPYSTEKKKMTRGELLDALQVNGLTEVVFGDPVSRWESIPIEEYVVNDDLIATQTDEGIYLGNRDGSRVMKIEISWANAIAEPIDEYEIGAVGL